MHNAQQTRKWLSQKCIQTGLHCANPRHKFTCSHSHRGQRDRILLRWEREIKKGKSEIPLHIVESVLNAKNKIALFMINEIRFFHCMSQSVLGSVLFRSVAIFCVEKHTNRENGNKMQTSSSAMWHRKPTNCVVYFEYSLRLWIHIYTYMPWWYLRKMTSFSVSLFVHSHIQYAWWCSLFTVHCKAVTPNKITF